MHCLCCTLFFSDPELELCSYTRIQHDLTIQGLPADQLDKPSIRCTNTDTNENTGPPIRPIFHITSGSVLISGLRISNGVILTKNAEVTFSDCYFANNSTIYAMNEMSMQLHWTDFMYASSSMLMQNLIMHNLDACAFTKLNIYNTSWEMDTQQR